MKAIYKYRLPFMEVSKVVLPKDSKVIRIDGFDGAIWLWAIVDTEEPLVERTFHLFKTGGEMPDDIGRYMYIGCGAIFIQMELMLYIFEDTSAEKFIGKQPAPFDWKVVQEKVVSYEGQ